MINYKPKISVTIVLLIIALVFFILFIVAGFYPITEKKWFGKEVTTNLFQKKDLVSLWTSDGVQLWLIRHSKYAKVFNLARAFSIVATIFILLGILSLVIKMSIYRANAMIDKKDRFNKNVYDENAYDQN